MKRLADQTLYEILEVAPDAAPPAISDAYERARATYGPGSLVTYTLMSAEDAALLTSRIEEAKRTLLDAEARARYDASLATGDSTPRPAGVNGAAAASFHGFPPVIPALKSPALEPPAPADAAPAAEAPAEEPHVAEEPVAEGPAAPAPIRLDREIQAPSPPREEPAAEVRAAAPEVPAPEGSLWSGEALRRVREARGISLQQMSERTKVTRHHVENIEAERFSALPAPVYLRGILLTVARELRLDGQKVARAYLERVAAGGQGAKK